MPVLVALGSFATTLLGGVAALRIGDRRHLVLGLAAGLMLGVVLFDLLPEALGEQPAYLFGVPVVLLAEGLGQQIEQHHAEHQPRGQAQHQVPAITDPQRGHAAEQRSGERPEGNQDGHRAAPS